MLCQALVARFAMSGGALLPPWIAAMMNNDYKQNPPPEQLTLALRCVPDPVRDHGLRAAHVWPRVGERQDTGFWSGRVSVECAWGYMYIDQSDAGVVWATLTYDCDDRQALGDGLQELPPPNWITRTQRGGHCTWCLAVPVAKHGAARAAPEQYLARIAEYFHHALGADPSFSGLGRNPAHPDADTIWGRSEPYSMDELAAVIPHGWRRPQVPQTGVGRNCMMHDGGMRWAGRWENRDIAVIVALHTIREEVCGLFPDADHPYTIQEMEATAKVIEGYRAEWLRQGWHKPEYLDEKSRKGRKSGEVRRSRTAARDEAIVMAVASGVSRRAVAREHGLTDGAVRHIVNRDRDLFEGA